LSCITEDGLLGWDLVYAVSIIEKAGKGFTLLWGFGTLNGRSDYGAHLSRISPVFLATAVENAVV